MRRFFMTVLPVLALAIAACGDDDENAGDDTPTIDASPIDAGAPDADCIEDPQTHLQIMNACTTAEGLTKTPVLKLQYADGGLPPLP